MEASNYCLINTTTNTKENADAITQLLLEKKLVACVQSTVIQSSYHWQGKIEKSEEIRLQMKTKRSLFEKIQIEIEEHHAYEVPEIIMIPLTNANTPYLQWIEDITINS